MFFLTSFQQFHRIIQNQTFSPENQQKIVKNRWKKSKIFTFQQFQQPQQQQQIYIIYLIFVKNRL